MRNDVARLRNEHGWTQAQLAAAAGVSRQTIISIERGRFDPGVVLALSLARCLGKTVEEVFFVDAPVAP